MSNANYPDWVLKYKSKGVYVSKKGDTYYLYRAHSQRIKGTNKVKRIFDGYIGRVTEKDGFIPVKDKITTDIKVYDFGVFCFLASLSFDIYKGFKKSYSKYADSIMALAIMNTINFNQDRINDTALFMLYPKLSVTHFSNTTVLEEATRCTKMIAHYIHTRVDDWDIIKDCLPSLHLVKVNNEFRLSSVDGFAENILDKYKVEVKKYAKSST